MERRQFTREFIPLDIVTRKACVMLDDKPKPRARRTQRLRAPSRDEYCRYIVVIESWDWSYSFSLDDRKDTMDPYMEHRHLLLGGKLLHPTNPSVKSVELCLLPRHDLDQDRRKDDQPTAVGSLRLDDGKVTALLPIPKDSLTPIMQMLIADRFKFADLGGAKLRHRQALVTSFSLVSRIDEDDMPSAGDAT